GVFRGRTRTYDLRGKRFAVVMAGNPYTESGARFRIPDMLANRADTFNLGDIVGGRRDLFELSYLENAVTSSPVLRVLAARDPKDFHALAEMSASGELRESALSAAYSASELQDMLDVIRKLRRVQDVLLRVNTEYIRSAAQSDEFRTEPAFKLQGSYRDMNKIAARVLPVISDEELDRVVREHYATEAQTLTGGAEQNLLKLGELLGTQSEAERTRWAEIRRTFQRRQALFGMNAGDQGAHVLAQLATFNENLEKIRATLAEAAARGAGRHALDAEALQALVARLDEARAAAPQQAPAEPAKVEIVNTLPKYYGNLYKHHIDVIESVLVPLVQGVCQQLHDQKQSQDLLRDVSARLKDVLDKHEALQLRDREASRIAE
ncbi:MAG: DNA repair protein, partial [Planctomycetota bacterium]|nr:DNA repair protein [Planctomycetota bacterium]